MRALWLHLLTLALGIHQDGLFYDVNYIESISVKRKAWKSERKTNPREYLTTRLELLYTSWAFSSYHHLITGKSCCKSSNGGMKLQYT